MADTYDLARFVSAQDSGGTYERAVEELRGGRKTSHWMWFVFPQIHGLGFSEMSRRYAIKSLGEAKTYLRHPILGPRLKECARLVIEAKAPSPEQIFGDVDAAKLQSSMTLFLRAASGEPLFQQVLDQYFSGKTDPRTDKRL